MALQVNTPYGLRLRLIDSDQVDASLNRELAGGVRIVQGVEFDASGRRTAYHILPDRSGLPFAQLALTPRRVPATDVVHMFRPETSGQVHGISWFAPQLVRQKIAALLTGPPPVSARKLSASPKSPSARSRSASACRHRSSPAT